MNIEKEKIDITIESISDLLASFKNKIYVSSITVEQENIVITYENGFKNKSIMCEGLMLYYENMYRILIKQGYSINELNKNLFT